MPPGLVMPRPGRAALEKLAAAREHRRPVAVGQQPVVADAVEAAGQHVQQEAAHELAGVQRITFGLVRPLPLR